MGDLFGQIVLKEAAGVVWVGKSGFEKFVVWMMDGFFWHGSSKESQSDEEAAVRSWPMSVGYRTEGGIRFWR